MKLKCRPDDFRVEERTERVPDGDAALRYMRNLPPFVGRTRPHLILLDLHLPGLSGLDVLREIKLDPALRSVPVVVLTTSDEPREMTEAYCLGANSYVVKPLDFRQLKDMLDDLTGYWCAWNLTA